MHIYMVYYQVLSSVFNSVVPDCMRLCHSKKKHVYCYLLIICVISVV